LIALAFASLAHSAKQPNFIVLLADDLGYENNPIGHRN